MVPAFDEVVSDLCCHLEIELPALAAGEFLALAAGSEQVLLKDGPWGRVIELEAEVGFLTRSEALEVAELEGLLKANLAQSLQRDVLVCLGVAEGMGPQRVLVKGFYRYDETDISRLVHLVSEVASSAEVLKGLLYGAVRVGENKTTQENQGALIFQP
ncbi:hypothetical protein FIV00_26310 [Labrenzia sp. THAF82]|uniref:hypothetical protein n=1 Tax=Labrenzia sp. THAF82 TaxID=2587861 RepID=UPI0012697796|nr:hypothetical protein [Labrenzia sp. THAF82]QFT34038.1 hypothetical protein FIV00_26310 [Labrenzia sp. THAF82]